MEADDEEPAFDELGEYDGQDELEEEPRTASQVATRCVMLYAMFCAGNGDERQPIVSWLQQQNLWESACDPEQAFLLADNPDEQQNIDATWQVEDLDLLLWALGKIESVDNLNECCDIEAIKSVCSFYLGDTAAFIESAKLRPEEEIEAVEEMIYDAHWQVNEALQSETEITDDLNPDVINERHLAVNWLMGYSGLKWDDVSIGT